MGQNSSKKKLLSAQKSPLQFEDRQRVSQTIHYQGKEADHVAAQFATETPGQRILAEDPEPMMAVTRPRRLT